MARLLVLLCLFAGCLAQRSFPNETSCAAVKAIDSFAFDGEYQLKGCGGIVVNVYCSGMSTPNPGEYITLQQTGGPFNFARYRVNTEGQGPVTTHYTRVRLDLQTCKVDIADRTFSTSQGTLVHEGVVDSMPFGSAMCCQAPSVNCGDGNIDFRGTQFSVTTETQFRVDGNAATGTFDSTNDKKVVALSGGGYCGWTWVHVQGYQPNTLRSPLPNKGSFVLQLSASPVSLAPTPFPSPAPAPVPLPDLVGPGTQPTPTPACQGTQIDVNFLKSGEQPPNAAGKPCPKNWVKMNWYNWDKTGPGSPKKQQQ